MTIITKYLTFKIIGHNPKTEIWGVFSTISGLNVGKISWWAQWRRYCFYPNFVNTIILDSECLKVIAEFLDAIMAEHRVKKKTRKIYGDCPEHTRDGAGNYCKLKNMEHDKDYPHKYWRVLCFANKSHMSCILNKRK